MEKLKVEKIIISKQAKLSENYKIFNKIVKDKKIKVNIVTKGNRLKIDKDLFIDILWPDNNKLILENDSILNNNSIVCKLKYKNFSMLFTGDIEKIAEKQILEEYKNDLLVLNSSILKVAHHRF